MRRQIPFWFFKFFLFNFFYLIFFALSSCATKWAQNDFHPELLSNDIPSRMEIQNAPFIQQTAGTCGPATLGMALKWAGHNFSMDELSDQTYTQKMDGSLQADMIGAARRQGMTAIPVSGFHDLILEISGGHPVIVFENLALSWWPRWHYALAIGYDLNKKEILLHSGPNAFQWVAMAEFASSWKLADYWGLVVLSPDQLAISGTEIAHSKSAALLEQIKKITEAKIAYQAILRRWPHSLGAHVGLANIGYTQGEFELARIYLQKALIHNQDSPIILHNLKVLKNSMSKNSHK